MRQKFARTGVVVALVAASVLAPMRVGAQSEASALSVLSAFPLASVLLASEATGAVAQASALLSAAGATLVVKSVESTARGTVYVLERVSDGLRISVQVTGNVAGATSLAVGTAVTVSVIAAGTVLSVAGQVLAFIPNAVGQALLYNRRLGN